MKIYKALIRAAGTTLLALLISAGAMANNVRVSNVTYVSNGDSIRFDLSWDNSWRLSTAPDNYDGVWVFVKFRNEGDKYLTNTPDYTHMWLDANPANHYAPSGASLDVGTSVIGGNTRGVGVFIYRSNDGSGTFSLQGIRLKWDKATQGVTHNELDIQVFAVEMTHAPQNSFYVGDGVSTNTLKDGSTSSPLQITSENALTLGTASGNLNQLSSNLSGTLPAEFPKGYNSIWTMKYEITQEQYKDFLNCLSRSNQNTYTATSLPSGTTTITNRFVMSNSTTPAYRNGIRCDGTVHTSRAINFYCDLNNNSVGNQDGDGLTLSCNYLTAAFITAYLDWACLRPMSELEYEKICRGPLSTVSYETAWGLAGNNAANFTYATNVNNSGFPYELPTTSGNGLIHANNGTPTADGPRRVGSTYTGATDRYKAGAAYFGNADMAGNLWEFTVRIADVSAFDGSVNGDGDINTSAPAAWTASSIYKGGAFNTTILSTCVSERSAPAPANQYISGRGVRY
jgi:formylglycine-generating enzyme required for sulfatase activity